jgi:antitoxin (DNA-binding transcriptional repressor) of toxin-antitoxin stability system
MTVTITELRKNLFQLVDRAFQGESLLFTYEGHRIRVVPEETPSKLSRISAHQMAAPGGISRASKQLRREMKSEWNKDWADL